MKAEYTNHKKSIRSAGSIGRKRRDSCATRNQPPSGPWLDLRAALRHPALWLSLALAANVLEGAFRKWVPGFSGGAGRALAYFSKDIIFGIGVMMLVSLKPRRNPALSTGSEWGGIAFALLGLGGLLSLTQGFNGTGAVLSLRALIILPLFGYFYAARVARFPLIGFAIIAVLLTFINAPLSLLQSGLPAGHILNKYAEDEMVVVEVASGVRATGTFAYLTGPAMVAVLGCWAGMVLLSLGKDNTTRALGTLGILSALACAFASGSRGGIVTVVAMVGLWALSSVRATRALWKSLWMSGLLVLATLLVFPTLAERFVTMGGGVFERFESAGDSNTQRAFGQFEELWHALTHHPVGTGLGTEQAGGNYVASGMAGFTQYENQFPRIVAEFGVIGFFGFLLLVCATLLALQATRGGSGSRWNLVVTATQITLLGQFYGSLVFNHTASALVWIIATAVLAGAPMIKRPRRDRRLLKSGPSHRVLRDLEIDDEVETARSVPSPPTI